MMDIYYLQKKNWRGWEIIMIDRYPIDETSGKRKIGLKASATMPILKFAKNSNTLRQVMEALANKCQEENTPRFLEVLKLRLGIISGFEEE